MDTAIWWIRRDLRLEDNPTLKASLEQAGQVVPLFIFDPSLLNSSYVGEKRLAFLFEGLRQLDQDLRKRASQLVLRKGAPLKVLSEVMEETGAEGVFAEEDHSPYARQRDQMIAKELPFDRIQGLTVRHPEEVLKEDGEPYLVFTPYSRAWKSLPLPSAAIPAPKSIPLPDGIKSQAIPDEPQAVDSATFPAGEAEARRRLDRFSSGESAPIFGYGNQRNRVDLEGTSQLSPYLRFGMLSARQAVIAALDAINDAESKEERKSAETWLNELIWREFYVAILFHFPAVRQVSFRQDLRAIQWQNDEEEFNQWCHGRTGYPIVDAAMRQLKEIGWMHNRARMIVASFLTKDLLIDWRWGERWFMQHLIDGDPAANNGGWQWTAGTGTDAAPYFRVFNPILQSKKFDPQGSFIRRWVPELTEVPDRYVHEPWTMPKEVQQHISCVIGERYPQPIIDHAWARQRALDVYKLAREKSY